jgi:hypothetical protein
VLEADVELDRREFRQVPPWQRPARLSGPAGDGPDFAFTVLDPPCFSPDGLRVSRPEKVST